MARRSAQTERLIQMVELLAASPGAELRLTDLAKSVGVDPATCYPMLTELTRCGWLVKDSRHRTYRLGPRFVNIGDAALVTLRAGVYGPVLDALAARTGNMTCLIQTSSTHLVISAISHGANDGDGIPLRLGDRVEFRPPVGSALAAWATPYLRNGWLDALPPDSDRSAAVELLDTVRKRRFAVELMPSTADFRRMVLALDEEVPGPRRATRIATEMVTPNFHRIGMLSEIVDDERYSSLSISAACFDAAGVVWGVVFVLCLDGPIVGADLLRLGRTVAESADEITRGHGGMTPWDAD
ncbi:helix-turn-helix domain-containing protein [Nocardia bovistercoris]|uniref:Helix-turn-helix domain-containing protein n=1 Tax=Nocardia bovistercoris TaxID=2785916 RepID=A0A931II98_9NOCA|nr:helix-turn-helix domain-containing protein [Nocardia bovistercoris]